MVGRRSLTATKDSLFSLLPVFGKHIWGKVSEMAVRVDSIVLFAPVLDDNTGLCQREEPPLIQALITQAVMGAFHMTRNKVFN